MNIFLIGYRCTGKTSVGRYIAEKIGWEIIDTDELLMKKAGETVTQIVAHGGWPLFRKLEKESLKMICLRSRQVVATGGGVVIDIENVELMKQSGMVIWLRATPDTIFHRMLQDDKTHDLRPSLTGRSLKMDIQDTLQERETLYKNAMAVEVDTEDKTLQEVSLEVLSLLNRTDLIDIPQEEIS